MQRNTEKFASVRVSLFVTRAWVLVNDTHARVTLTQWQVGYTVVTIMACHVHVSTKLDARLRCGRWPGIGSTRRARWPAPTERRQLSRSALRANHFDSAEDRKCWQHHDLLVGKRHVLISSVVSLLQLGLTQVAVADQVSSVWLLYKLMMMNE